MLRRFVSVCFIEGNTKRRCDVVSDFLSRPLYGWNQSSGRTGREGGGREGRRGAGGGEGRGWGEEQGEGGLRQRSLFGFVVDCVTSQQHVSVSQ